MGTGTEDKKQVNVVNKVITSDDNGVLYEPYPRHAELMVPFIRHAGVGSIQEVSCEQHSERNRRTRSSNTRRG